MMAMISTATAMIPRKTSFTRQASSVNNRDGLEDAHPYVEELPRVRANVAHQLSQFADRAIHVLIQLPITQQLTGGALALLQACHDLVQAFGHGVQPVVQRPIADKSAGGPLSTADASRDGVEVCCRRRK